LRSRITGAVKVVTHDGRGYNRHDAIYRRRLLGSLKIAETSVTARFLMIAKDFMPQMGAKCFVIMKELLGIRCQRGSRDRCEYLCSAGAEGLFMRAAAR
jgi:hypothetical protein